jgi:hypothetical protein
LDQDDKWQQITDKLYSGPFLLLFLEGKKNQQREKKRDGEKNYTEKVPYFHLKKTFLQ